MTRKSDVQDQKNQQSAQRLVIITGAVIVGLLVIYFGITQLTGQNAGNRGPSAQDVDFRLAEQPRFGNENAQIQLVEFGDYMCSHCKEFHETVFENIKDEYVMTGQVALYYINLPILGQPSQLAAHASECVYERDPENFWTFHEALFYKQTDFARDGVDAEILAETAVDLAGVMLDEGELAQCIRDRSMIERYSQDLEIAQSLDIQGTPAIFVNGTRLRSYSQNTVVQAIEAEME